MGGAGNLLAVVNHYNQLKRVNAQTNLVAYLKSL